MTGARPSFSPSWTLRAALAGLVLALSSSGWAQSVPAQAQPLPRAFRGVSLGMELEQVKQALAGDPLFRYRGDPDVSFLPQSAQVLIECPGTAWIRRAYFQFVDSRLFIMILVLDTQKVDHYSLFTAVSKKYGQPSSLSPQESVWAAPDVRFSIERPLTVKYIDAAVFSRIVQQGVAAEDLEKLSREQFIEQF